MMIAEARSVWRWLVALFIGKRHETAPDDVRFYETLHRDQIEKTAKDATNAQQHGMY